VSEPLYHMARPASLRASQMMTSYAAASSEPITLCALFYGPTRLTPKVQILLDFLEEYIGTDRDPRVKHGLAKGCFTDRKLAPTSGP